MKKITQNSFSKGLNMDLNPLSTPKDVLTDCLNGTVITYNGDEFSLQTDMGNSRATIIGDSNDIPDGFIPIGMKEFNNILYIVAHNPITKESKVGSFPAPQRYLPLHNSDTDNLITKTVYDKNKGTSIWELTKELTVTGQINHGMNLLTSYLKKGDKYKISLSLKGITDSTTANDILRKFINNYHPKDGEGVEGYFDLKYFAFSSDGVLRELPVNIYPENNSKISDIEYSPNPFISAGSINGVSKVMDKDGPNVIVAAFIPKSIEKFDFKLQSYNTGGILRARVVFASNLIDDSKSAIKLKTIKIITKNTKLSGLVSDTHTSYYDYATWGTSQAAIIENINGTSFEVGTLITTTCIPMDQFGRELIDKSVTHTYQVASVLLGTEGHDLFKYTIVGNNLLLDYNFLNDMVGVTTTNIEFYDFWSGVSKLIPNIAFTTGREVSIEVALVENMSKSTLFTTDSYGGIPTNTLRLPTATERILGTHITSASLRKNHCYLVRIFGIDNNVDYSIFQLLYTLPIPIFTNSYLNTRNFGTIDIIQGLTGNSLKASTSGNLFQIAPLNLTTETPLIENITSNYADSGSLDLSLPFRLYGGPVFEEEENGMIATWDTGNAYYRNVYTGSFSKVGPGIEKIGYHEFPESAINTLLTGGGTLGTDLPVSLFVNQSKNYLRGGLMAPSTSSQKDFKFMLSSYIRGAALHFNSTVEINPVSLLDAPLLFGNVDMGILTKQIKLGNYTGNVNGVISIDPSAITEVLNWSEIGVTPPSFIEKSSKITSVVLSSDVGDTVIISDFELKSQRYIYGDSSFKYYVRKFSRNKLFRYFAMKHTQTMRVRIILDTDYTDLTKHTGYLFSGSMDNTNVDIQIRTTPGVTNYGVVSKYKLIPSPTFDATLVWASNPIAFTIPDILNNMGVQTIIPLNSTEVTNTLATAAKDNTKILKFISFTSTSNTIEQYIYKTFKTAKPSNVKISIDDASSPLYTNSHLWKWDDTDFYIATDSIISEDYLSKLILYQNYQEIILGQYPKNNIVYNTESTTTVNLTDNHLEYFINTQQADRDKHLTKSCFGSSVMDSFSISKFASIISIWEGRHGPTVKNIYDFTNNNLSIGYAKNIPWNFTNSSLSKIDIADLSLSMAASTPEDHIEWFQQAENKLNDSIHLRSSEAVTPVVKAIIYNQAQPVKSNFIITENTSNTENINKSDIVIPLFNSSALRTKIQPITNSYGINFKLSDPPTIDQIYRGLNIQVGDYYGGGIVFKVYTDSTGVVTGGLIAADPRYFTPRTDWYMNRGNDSISWTVGSKSTINGFANTQYLRINVNTKDLATEICTEHRGGGYSDWYFPASEEMGFLRAYSLVADTPVLIKGAKYWTSTELDWERAIAMYIVPSMFDTVSPTEKRYNSLYAHPIRKF